MENMEYVKIVNEYNLDVSLIEESLIEYWIDKKINSRYDLPTIIPVNERLMLDFHSYKKEGVLLTKFSKQWLGIKTKRKSILNK